MAFTIKKNPSQLLRYRQSMMSGEQFKEHMSHLRTQDMKVGQAPKNTAASPNKQ